MFRPSITQPMTRTSSATVTESKNVTAIARSRQHAAPTPEQIRVRAYEIFLARGAAPGREVEDWLQAENSLRANPNVVTR